MYNYLSNKNIFTLFNSGFLKKVFHFNIIIDIKKFFGFKTIHLIKENITVLY